MAIYRDLAGVDHSGDSKSPELQVVISQQAWLQIDRSAGMQALLRLPSG